MALLNIIIHHMIDKKGFSSLSFCRRSDSDDKDDPHKALGNIVLDDFLDPLPVKVFRLRKLKSS